MKVVEKVEVGAKTRSVNWKHTYLENDIFKVLVIGSNKQFSEATAKWLAGTDETWRGIFARDFNNSKVAFYYTWPNDEEDLHQNTIGIDAMCASLEKEDQWPALKNEIGNFAGIPVKLLISDFGNGAKCASQLKMEFLLRNEKNALDVVTKLDSLDLDEFEKLKKQFNSYDKDGSGSISNSEMTSIAKELGVDVKSETFMNSLKALDINQDQQLDLEEFLQWYKIGRIHVVPISKIYELNNYVKNLVRHYLSFDALLKDIQDPNISNKKTLNNIKVFLESGKLNELVTRIHLKLTLGGTKRIEASKNFLSKFTAVHSYSEASWINIAVFTKPLSMNGQDLLKHMEAFRDKLISWAEKSHLQGLSSFIKQFIEFRQYSNDTAANIYMKLKLDIEALMKTALDPILIIRDWLSDSKNSFDVNVRLFSSACLGELLKKKKSIADLLNEGEVEINANVLKARLRSLLSNAKPEYSSLLGIFQFFFMSTNLNLKFKGPFNEFANKGSFKFFNEPLTLLEPLINFIKENFSPEVLKCFSRMEFTFNLFEMFMNIPSLFRYSLELKLELA